MATGVCEKKALTQIDTGCSRFHVPLKQVYIGMAATATSHEMEAAGAGTSRVREISHGLQELSY